MSIGIRAAAVVTGASPPRLFAGVVAFAAPPRCRRREGEGQASHVEELGEAAMIEKATMMAERATVGESHREMTGAVTNPGTMHRRPSASTPLIPRDVCGRMHGAAAFDTPAEGSPCGSPT